MSSSRVLVTRKRLLVVLIIMAIIIILLMTRVGYWSLLKGDWLQQQAQSQWTKDVAVDAKRGSILDRNQYVLAQSAAADTVVLQPEKIASAGNADQVADELSRILEMPREEVYAKATNTEKKEIWLKRQITQAQSDEIEGLQMKGVSFVDDVKRFYLNKDFASQVIGYTNADGAGQTGIEKRYESTLAGRQGRQVTETAKDGSGVPNGQEMTIEPQDGLNVVLTIDEVVQSSLEDSCKSLYGTVAPDSVQGLVMDVTSGEILGMANIPEFDLNSPPRDDAGALASLSVNNITATPVEPGDIFSIFTAAAATNEGTATEVACTGSVMIDGEKISCPVAHGTQGISQVAANHCSVGAAQLAQGLSKDTFYAYLKNFGFGQKTGIDFSTDSAGEVLQKKYVRDVDIAFMGAGESMKVSQLQMANAMASLLNGGNLYTPRLVLGLSDSNGNMTETYGAELKNQTVSADTAAQMRDLMVNLVQEGAGSAAQITGYSVGGIGGSAIQYVGDIPQQGKEVATYFTFAPADNPKYLVMITANGVAESGENSMLCAPYAKNVLEEILKSSGIAPSDEAARNEQKIAVPAVTGMDMQTAKDTLASAGFIVQLDGSGVVQGQMPAAGEEAFAGSTVSLTMEIKNPEENQAEMVVVPDFTGMDFETAKQTAIAAGLEFVAYGNGVALGQKPVAGLQVEKGSVVSVTFQLQIDNP
ncbi:MAG: penicillin-binding transpeptidase domain-containing protein [Christensenella sp.]|nr:penicillin-binding transpeptidase domain-containing protein [Christensenella sp.]